MEVSLSDHSRASNPKEGPQRLNPASVVAIAAHKNFCVFVRCVIAVSSLEMGGSVFLIDLNFQNDCN